jgi:hypothetical protein
MITRRTIYLLVAALALAASLAGASLRHASAASATSLLPTSITLTSNLNPAMAGSTLTFSGVLSPSTARGPIVLYDNTTGTPVELGRVSFISTRGAWSLSLSPYSANYLSIGTHYLTASYLGNATYQGSTSPTYVQRITMHW